MPPIIEGPPGPDDPRPPLLIRLLWFFGLGLASLAVVGAIAYALRALIL